MFPGTHRSGEGHRAKWATEINHTLVPKWSSCQHATCQVSTGPPVGNTDIHTSAGWRETWKLPSHSSTSSQHRAISAILCWIGMQSADGPYLSQDTRSLQGAAQSTKPYTALPAPEALYKDCPCTSSDNTNPKFMAVSAAKMRFTNA